MSCSATIFRAMIASPSDVAAERQLIRDVVYEWTAIHSEDRGCVLLPVAWESHASPEMGDRPQGIINKRLLKDCDLLVAAFWTRVGTPTGQATSGTIEEIEEHIAAGKEAMIYFSQAPVRLDSVDADQYEALKEFRTNCQGRGLYETYDSLSEFRDKLSRQLATTMIRLFPGRTPDALAIGRDAADGQLRDRSQSTEPELSLHAQRLLKSASVEGHFMRLDVSGGVVIQVNGKVFNTPADARDAARWDAAIKELEQLGLIEGANYKREYFQVTHAGYERADRIAPDV